MRVVSVQMSQEYITNLPQISERICVNSSNVRNRELAMALIKNSWSNVIPDWMDVLSITHFDELINLLLFACLSSVIVLGPIKCICNSNSAQLR